MHGETRSRRRYYRCPVPRSYPQASQDHPRSVYVREDALLRALDEWIAELFAPERVTETSRQLVEAVGADAERAARVAEARQHLGDAGRQLAQYRTTLDAGGDPVTISRWITEAAERERAARSELDAALRAGPPPLTVDDVETAVRELGGLVAILEQADATDRAELYEALGVGAKYDAATHTAVLEVEPAWGQLRVGGGT